MLQKVSIWKVHIVYFNDLLFWLVLSVAMWCALICFCIYTWRWLCTNRKDNCLSHAYQLAFSKREKQEPLCSKCETALIREENGAPNGGPAKEQMLVLLLGCCLSVVLASSPFVMAHLLLYLLFSWDGVRSHKKSPCECKYECAIQEELDYLCNLTGLWVRNQYSYKKWVEPLQNTKLTKTNQSGMIRRVVLLLSLQCTKYLNKYLKGIFQLKKGYQTT